MLKGKVVALRPIVEADLPQLYEHILDIENRGEYWPVSIQTMSQLRKDLAEHGFWKDDFGSLAVIDNESGALVGQMFWFKTVQYMVELEIGYIMYDTTKRSRGGTTEGLKMLTGYLFDTMQFNRVRLCIDSDNGPSRRVAEKAGYKHEGTQRGCFWSKGNFRDMELYAVTRTDWTEISKGS